MIAFSVQEVIEQAIQTEKLGTDFYTRMAEKFQENEEFRNLFEMLAAKEVAHEKIFHSIKESIDSNYEIPDNWEEASKYLRAIVESEFFLGSDNVLSSSIDHLESVNDVLNFAITFEKVTLLYFHELRNVINDKEAVDDIINEEKSHIIWLSDYKKKLNS